MKRQVLPPTYLLVSLLIMLALYFLLPGPKFIPVPWNLLGAIPLAAGVALNLVADGAFKRAETTVKPFEGSTALVTSGAYALSRHPMYLGYVLILAGVAILLRAATPWAVIPVFALLIDRVFIRVEERMLGDKFGEAYEAYRQRVRRWI